MDVALESGFQVYLTKPLDPMTVVVEIERLYWESQDAA
jgi:DNA-binding response OmpR family regulator